MTHLQAWADIVVETDARGVSKQSIQGAGADLVRVTVPARASPPVDIIMITSNSCRSSLGSGELETEQGVKRFGPGSLFVFPAGTWHSARFEIETVLVEANLHT